MKLTVSIAALLACLATTAAAAAVETPFDHAAIAQALKGKVYIISPIIRVSLLTFYNVQQSERKMHWWHAIAMSMKCPSAWVPAATLPVQRATSDAVLDAAALLAAAKLSNRPTKPKYPMPVFDHFDPLDRK
jgi:hypothetical protein